MPVEKEGVRERVSGFVERLQELVNSYYAANYDKLVPPNIKAEKGSRYVRVVRVDVGHKTGSAHCFIDLTNGDVLKAASYKAPAKHARSNVFNFDYGISGVGPHGANYLK